MANGARRTPEAGTLCESYLCAGGSRHEATRFFHGHGSALPCCEAGFQWHMTRLLDRSCPGCDDDGEDQGCAHCGLDTEVA